MHNAAMAQQPEVFKPTMIRIYLNADETRMLKTICDRTELEQTELATKLTKAALRAISESGNKLILPLRFALIDPDKMAPIILRDENHNYSSPSPKKK